MKYQELWHLLSYQQNSLANISIEPVAVGPPDLKAFRVNQRCGIQLAPRLISIPELLVVEPLRVNILISFVDGQAPPRSALRIIQVEKIGLVVQNLCIVFWQDVFHKLLGREVPHTIVDLIGVHLQTLHFINILRVLVYKHFRYLILRDDLT